MDSDHILSLASDYALGLLTAEERRRVERHAGQCPTCRVALQRERGIEALVRGAVHQAARPAPGRLAALRPAAAARPASRRPAPLLRRLAPMSVATVLVALGLLFGRDATPFAPAVFAGGTPTRMATATQTPTATLAAVDPTATEPSLSLFRLAAPAAPEPPAASPSYAATPAPLLDASRVP